MSSPAEKLEAKMKHNGQETRIALLEQSIENINKTLIRMEKKIDDGFNELKNDLKDFKKESKENFNKLDQKIDTLEINTDKKLDGIYSRIWQLFLYGIAAFIGMFGIMGHGFKWF